MVGFVLNPGSALRLPLVPVFLRFLRTCSLSAIDAAHCLGKEELLLFKSQYVLGGGSLLSRRLGASPTTNAPSEHHPETLSVDDNV